MNFFADKLKSNNITKNNDSSSVSSEEEHLEEDIGQGFFGDESEEADNGDSDVCLSYQN